MIYVLPCILNTTQTITATLSQEFVKAMTRSRIPKVPSLDSHAKTVRPKEIRKQIGHPSSGNSSYWEAGKSKSQWDKIKRMIQEIRIKITEKSRGTKKDMTKLRTRQRSHNFLGINTTYKLK